MRSTRRLIKREKRSYCVPFREISCSASFAKNRLVRDFRSRRRACYLACMSSAPKMQRNSLQWSRVRACATASAPCASFVQTRLCCDILPKAPRKKRQKSQILMESAFSMPEMAKESILHRRCSISTRSETHSTSSRILLSHAEEILQTAGQCARSSECFHLMMISPSDSSRQESYK